MKRQLGDYMLLEKIGAGGMGDVYRARQVSLDREVAVKVLPRSLAKEPNFIQRFQREAKSAANLIHPNVIQIYSIGIEEGIPYFAMEYVEGEDLQKRMKRVGRLSYEETVNIVAGVAQALQMAAERGIVHRDIKPSNIMLDKADCVKVMDFGLAKVTSASDANLTQTGLIMGTPNYISPEQGQGLPLDSRSDVYSLGIVMYELLTGQRPFRADTPASLIYKHAFESPDPPTSVKSDVPPFLEHICLRMIAKDPNERYPTPQDLLDDLQEFQRHLDFYLAGGMPEGRKNEKPSSPAPAGSKEEGKDERTIAVPTPSGPQPMAAGDLTGDHTVTIESSGLDTGKLVAILVALIIVVGAALVVILKDDIFGPDETTQTAEVELRLSELKGYLPPDIQVEMEQDGRWTPVPEFADRTVEPGKFRLRFLKQYHQNQTITVTLDDDGSLTPPWSQLRIDPPPRAKLPLREISLSDDVDIELRRPGSDKFIKQPAGFTVACDPGEHTLRFTKRYHVPQEEVVQVSPTGCNPPLSTIRVDLKPQAFDAYRPLVPMARIREAIPERWREDIVFVINQGETFQNEEYGPSMDSERVLPDKPVQIILRKKGYSDYLYYNGRLEMQDSVRKLLARASAVEFDPTTEMEEAWQAVEYNLNKDVRKLQRVIDNLSFIAQRDPKFHNAGKNLRLYEEENNQLESYLVQASELAQEGRYQEAHQKLDRIEKADWSDFESAVRTARNQIKTAETSIASVIRQVEDNLKRGELKLARSRAQELLTTTAPNNKRLETVVTDSEKAEKALAKARLHREAEEWGKALDAYDEVLEICTAAAALEDERAKVAENWGDESEITAHLEKARKLLEEGRPESALQKVKEVEAKRGTSYEPAANLREVIVEELETRSVKRSFTRLDEYLLAKDLFNVNNLFEVDLQKKLQERIKAFFDENLEFEESQHKDLDIKFNQAEDGEYLTARVKCRWAYTIHFPGIPADEQEKAVQKAELDREITLKKDGANWLFTSFVDSNHRIDKESGETGETGAGGSGDENN